MSQSTPSAGFIPRRHDLDALRAIAMLLGIVLHGALSFIPAIGEGWAVNDTQASPGFGVLLAAIHGFRMQLFFLISGFFTAMLWRKRGLRPLLWHRFKRIFMPLVLGMFTVIPAMWAVSIGIGMADANEEKASNQAQRKATDAWTAAASGDLEVLKRSINTETDLDGLHPTWNSTLLMVAALHDHPELVAELLERGASPKIANSRNDTALHLAAFFGSAESAALLIDAGAPLGTVNQDGSTPLKNTQAAWWLTKMVAGMVERPVKQETVEKGRHIIAEQIQEAMGTAGPESVASQAAQSPGQTRASAWKTLKEFPLFGHLWFLYFLCWMVLGFAVLVGLASHTRRPMPAKRLTTSAVRYLWCIPATAALQGSMVELGNVFGPATSIGIVPIFSVLAYYAVFFGFGALYFDAHDDESRLTKFWPAMLAISAVLFPIGLTLGRSQEPIPHWLGAFCQAAYAWLMCFGFMGLFRAFFGKQNKAMRYLSDASYWMYLVHIPLIIPVQFWVRDWNMNPILKFLIVCSVTFVILLISYQILCRHTPIRWLLNGRVKRQTRPASEEPIEARLVPLVKAGN
ncbi:MAG: acyltransferase family protein [Planctomycetota bacterium]